MDLRPLKQHWKEKQVCISSIAELHLNRMGACSTESLVDNRSKSVNLSPDTKHPGSEETSFWLVFS